MKNFVPFHRSYGELCGSRLFGEKRISDRYDQLFGRMCSHPSVIPHQLSHNYAEEAAFYRLLANERFRFEDIIRAGGLSTLDSSLDRSVVVVGDSTELNLESRADHYSDEDCGYLSSNSCRGLHVHVNFALDAERGWVLGLCDLLTWNRPKAQKKKGTRQREAIPVTERESHKWLLGVEGSAEVLAQAREVTYVFDRDADTLRLFQHIESKGHHFVIRTKSDRRLAKLPKGQVGPKKVSDALAQSSHRGTHTLFVRGDHARKNAFGHLRKARKQREAELEICYTRIELPKGNGSYYVVDALEKPSSVPKGEVPIHWRLITNHELNSLGDALQMLAYYERRWIIEELFRTIKSKGFQVETVQLRKVSSVRKMVALAVSAGIHILQLNLAKAQSEPIPIETGFRPQEVLCLKFLSQQLEGKTQKLKNPYPPNSLLFAHWVMARLGGWKGYQSKRPAGPITICRGTLKFYNLFQMFELRNQIDVWEP